MSEVSGKSAKILITSVTGTSSTDNAATRSTGAGTNTGYIQINDTTKRHFDLNSTGFKVWRGASEQSATLYDINYVQGIFQWRTGDPSTGTYTVDVIARTASYLADAREWSLDVDTDMLDVTTFSTSTADKQWRDFVPGLSGATISIGRLVSTSTGPVFFDRINLGSDFVFEGVTSARNRLEAYARVESDGWSAPIDGTETEDVTLRVTGPVYYSTT